MSLADPLAHLDETLIRPEAITAGRIFLSYSRRNREFAKAYYGKLTRIGFKLWRDVHDIDAGADDWWQSIQEAIRECETVILCMSLPALKSPVVSDEWLYARAQGKRIIPVVVDDIWDHPEVKDGSFTIPNWMQRKNWLDFRPTAPEADSAWANLIRTLNERYTAKRFISMVEELPPRFVRRPDDIDQAIRGLVDDKNDAVAMTTALAGAGGYGKTTLAKAVARDLRIQGAFDDGILWVTLGEKLLELQGDALSNILIGRVRELIYALTGETPVIETLEMARTRLHDAIGDLYILLVIDDVWDTAHLAPFLLDSHKTLHSACLITTRNLNTVDRKNILKQTVDRMKPVEAAELLGAGFDPDEVKTNDASLRELARELREYPLLLSLANTQIANYAHDMGLSLTEALELGRETLHELGVLGFDDSSAASRNEAISKSLDVSIRQITPAERQRLYRELAIFPNDALIPLTTLEKYWGLPKIATLQFCTMLYRKTALLHSFEGLAVRLHDIYRDCLIVWERERLPALHRRLTDSWGVTAGAAVTALPDEYAWRNLAYHLTEGGQAGVLRSLLLDYHYLLAKLDATDTSALLADYDICEDDPAVRLIKSALAMSAHWLQEDKLALAHQLIGRLMFYRRTNAAIRALTDEIMPITPGLYPIDYDSDYCTHDQAGGALFRVLAGHTDRVNSAAYSPDGQYIVSASGDSTVCIWDAGKGMLLHTLAGHAKGVKSATYSPDGQYIVSASGDLTVRIWDAGKGMLLHTLTGHAKGVNNATYSPDGRYIVSASDDFTVRIWDAGKGMLLHTLTGHAKGVNNTTYSPDGRYIVSASDDFTVRIWDAGKGMLLHTLAGHTNRVNNATYSPDGQYIVSASGDLTVRIWDAGNGDILRTLVKHSVEVDSVAYSPDGRYIVSADGVARTLRIWEAESGTLLYTLTGHTTWVKSATFSPDGKYIISASGDETVRVWHAGGGTAIPTLTGHTVEVSSVAYSPDGRYVVSAGGGLQVWTPDGALIRTLTGQGIEVGNAAFSPDGRYIVATGFDVSMWETGSGTLLYTLSGHTNWVNSAAFSPDGKHIVSASTDQTVRVWDAVSGALIHILTGHTGWVTSAAFSPDGKQSSPHPLTRLCAYGTL